MSKRSEGMTDSSVRRPSVSDPPFLERVVRVAAAYEAIYSLSFSIVTDAGRWAGLGSKEGKLTVSVNCNDLFYWATADAEPIETDADLEMLEECLKIDDIYGATIYACRKRKMRPQNSVIKTMPDDIIPHLEACGPPRTDA